jgi:hypothetical protein
MITAETDQNLSLTEEAKELYFKNLTPEQVECRRKGMPMEMGSIVYFNFDQRRHVPDKLEVPFSWKGPLEPPDDWNRAYAIDPHGGKPHAVLFVAWSETAVVLYHEIWDKCLLADKEEAGVVIPGLATKIKSVMKDQYFNFQRCDPIAWNADPVGGRVWAQIFWDMGLEPLRAPKCPEIGAIQARGLWSETQRRVIVLPRLKRFLKEIRIYHYDDEGKPVDEENDMMENFYRLALVTNNFKFRPNPVRIKGPRPASAGLTDESMDLTLPESAQNLTT